MAFTPCPTKSRFRRERPRVRSVVSAPRYAMRLIVFRMRRRRPSRSWMPRPPCASSRRKSGILAVARGAPCPEECRESVAL
eukprot:2806132-Prymnesium_polylepis.1